MGKHNTLSFQARRTLADLIESHCKKVAGFAVYDEGYSDILIAEASGGIYTVVNVRNMRNECVGQLAPKVVKEAATEDQLRKMIEDVMERVTQIEEYITAQKAGAFHGIAGRRE